MPLLAILAFCFFGIVYPVPATIILGLVASFVLYKIVKALLNLPYYLFGNRFSSKDEVETTDSTYSETATRATTQDSQPKSVIAPAIPPVILDEKSPLTVDEEFLAAQRAMNDPY